MKKRKLNSKIWETEEIFVKTWNLFIEMPDKRMRFFPVYIDQRKWNSLMALYDGGKKEELQKKLKSCGYKDYLNSDYWGKLRKHVKERDCHKCRICNSQKNLNVHHRNYDKRGEFYYEAYELITLCGECHEVFHKNRKIEMKKI